MTPGDSEAGTVSVSVTGVVAVVVSSSEELMKEVVLEAEGLVVTGVWANCSPSVPSPSASGSLLTPERGTKGQKQRYYLCISLKQTENPCVSVGWVIFLLHMCAVMCKNIHTS